MNLLQWLFDDARSSLPHECKSDVSDNYTWTHMGSRADTYTQEVTLLSEIAAVIYGCV